MLTCRRCLVLWLLPPPCPCSTKKSVPISLLIMSRAFTLQAPDPAKALAQSISAMDDDVVTEVRSAQHRVACMHNTSSPFPPRSTVVFTSRWGSRRPSQLKRRRSVFFERRHYAVFSTAHQAVQPTVPWCGLQHVLSYIADLLGTCIGNDRGCLQ